MLNEIREYQEYTKDIVSSKRISPLLFRDKNGAGISRALTIIARFELFNRYHYDLSSTEEEQNEIRDKVYETLKNWCDFSYNKGFLKKYLSTDEKFLQGYMGADFEEKWNDFKLKKKHWDSKDPFYPVKVTIASQNMFNFATIIADAIILGELKDYVLICKDTYKNNVKKLEDGEVKSLRSTDTNKLLKLVAIYLLTSKNSSIPAIVSKYDFGNWVAQPTFATSHQVSFTYNGKTAIAIKGRILDISQIYIDDNGFEIIEKNSQEINNRLKNGYKVFEDTGCGKDSLKEIKAPKKKKKNKKPTAKSKNN